MSVLWTGCRSDVSVIERGNVAPAVAIFTPTDGSTFTELDTVELQASVADGNGLDDIQSVRWTSDLDGAVLDGTPAMPDGGGNSRGATHLSIGTHTLSVLVVDASGLDAMDAVTLTVGPSSQVPLAEIVAPGNLDTFDLGDSIDLLGAVSDPNQSPGSLTVTWTWELTPDPTLHPLTFTGPSGAGSTSAVLEQPEQGTYVITLEVVDDDLNRFSDAIEVVVEDPFDRDLDLDGYSVNEGDCDDSNPDRFPGNPEICDGLDNDCNSVIDDKDDDGDQHVDELCSHYPGALALDDCDDEQPTVYAGAAERPDGLDNDCNNLVDDGTPAYDADGDCFCPDLFACTGSVNAACTSVLPKDCDDANPLISPADTDGDGASACAGDCDDTNATLNLADADHDGASTCDGDCDDANPNLESLDADNDGASTCDGDCDDTDAALNLADADGDGFTTCADDCDDDPRQCGAACSPGLTTPDTCDGRDNNCDGAVDEDPELDWFADVDGDGFTDGTSTHWSCVDPDGLGKAWVADPSTKIDCDDSPLTCGAGCYPGRTGADTCDGYDRDCDGQVDEDPEIDWFFDEDLDGFTDGTTVRWACTLPSSTGEWRPSASTKADCDDKPSTCGADCFPGNTAPDICDTYNQDCDTQVDEDPDVVWYHDADSDGFTNNAAPLKTCQNLAGVPGWSQSPTLADCDDDPAVCGAGCFPGNTAADICDGRDQDCDSQLDENPDTPWYHDKDGDTFTNNADITRSCTDPDLAGLAWLSGSTVNDCDDDNATLNPADADGDGISSCDGDCNDTTSAVKPGNADAPDALYRDTNCDGIDGSEASAVFVATTGADNGSCGGKTAPCATIAYAGGTRAPALGKSELYVAAGTYAGPQVWNGLVGLKVYGGYDAAWVRAHRSYGGHEVNLAGGTYLGEAMAVWAHSSDLTLENLVITAPDAFGSVGGQGKSSYAVHVKDGAIELLDVAVKQGNGAAGLGAASNGVSASAIAAAKGGGGGNARELNTSCDSSTRIGAGAGGVNSSCPSANGGAGGSGGTVDISCDWGCTFGNCNAGSGINGVSASTYLTGGYGYLGGGGAGGNVGASGGPGHDGTTSDGSGGGGASAAGAFTGDLWYGYTGGSGALGAHGTGGGGGGGGGGGDQGFDDLGGGGGGGGAGGCRASVAGSGGRSGGSSFGVFAINSTVRVKDTTFTYGTAGNGGAGGSGGAGQPGGGVGAGGSAFEAGGKGGDGGAGARGGHSGAGGGGAGGNAYALYSLGSAIVNVGGNSGSGGAAGSGGPGGTVGVPGAPGANGTKALIGSCTSPGGC